MSKKTKLLKPTNDYVFKRIFSYEGKDNIAKDFIEAVTNYNISNIDIDKTTILEKDLPDDKIGGTEMSENENIKDAKKILDDISKDKEEQISNRSY